MTRKEANREIVNKILNVIEKNPEMRFGQILTNMTILANGIDPFYEESETILERVNKQWWVNV